MNKLRIKIVCLIILFVFPFQIMSQSEETDIWWDEEYSFRKRIEIPFDTSEPLAKHQPINTRIYFEHPCFAQNENLHSIRIIFQDDKEMIELESQIYDLNYSGDNLISSCSIVFLIPPEADGSEQYYLYYDESKGSPVDYPDHVHVEKNHYRYEPIPGYPFESSYFKITQHESVVYGVSYGGEFLGLGTAHQITKFSKGTDEVKSPKNAESWGSFDFFYNTGENTEDFSSTIQSLLSKKIIIDGNLMVKMSITSTTPKGEIQTTAEYTYFYCPTDHKRIRAYVKHEALRDINVYDSESVGNICGLQAGVMKSPSIQELNFGEMFSYMHVYDESNVVKEYVLDTNPEYTPEGIPILTKKDDVDLGKKAWASFDNGETGLAHGIIFSSNEKIISGQSENKGIQINALEGSTPGLLGLETDLVSFYFTRNAYEDGSTDLQIPSDFVAEFDAEFVTTYDDGYTLINNESFYFQKLISLKPTSSQQEYDDEKEYTETFDLTAYIHLTPTPPMGSVLSLISGFNFSFLTGELYQDNTIISSDISERISLNIANSIEGDTISKKILSLIRFVDWKNISIFKKLSFPDLEPDTYLLKIYRENPLFNNNREFIGFSLVNLTKNTKIHIIPKKQAELKTSLVDQTNNPIKDATFLLKYDNNIISRTTKSNDKGIYELFAPYSLTKPYDLEILFQGFSLVTDKIKLKYIHTIFPLEESYITSLSNLNLEIKDTWHLVPPYQLNPTLTSTEMTNKKMLGSTKIEDTYVFSSVPYAEYHLQIKYKSFNHEEKIDISSKIQKRTITFPAEYPVTLSVFDNRGLPINQNNILLTRQDQQKEIQTNKENKLTLDLPPGIYDLKVNNLDDTLIGERSIEVIGERSYEIVTKESSILDTVQLSLGLILTIIGLLLIYIKRPYHQLIRFLIFSLLILSILMPWWTLHCESNEESISSRTQLYILPPSLMTITESNQEITGARGLDFLPAQLQYTLYFFSIGVILSCVLLIGTKIVEKKCSMRWGKITTVTSVILLIILLVVFILGVSMISKIGVGSFIGQGDYSLNMPGEDARVSIPAQWGPGIGFYLSALSVMLIIILYITQYTNWIDKRYSNFLNKKS